MGSAQSKTNKLTLVIGKHGSYDIYLTNMDGTNPVNLSRSPADDLYPQWTPQGDKMAFVSNRDGFYELYVMDVDGSHIKRLTHHKTMVTTPVVGYGNPVKIAFVSTRDGKQDIYVTDIDGKNERKLTKGAGVNQQPLWSPNGEQILFVSTRDGNHEIYVMDSDGAHQRNLTRHPANDTSPRLSPALSAPYEARHIVRKNVQIAFVSNRDGNKEIYVMDVDGSHQRNVTHTPGNEEFPAWTPTGEKMTFLLNQSGLNQLMLMGAEGSVATMLSLPDKNVCGHPIWLNSETAVGYYVEDGIGLQFYIADSDGYRAIDVERTPSAGG